MPRTKIRSQSVKYSEKLNNLCLSVDNYAKILSESMLYDLVQDINVRIMLACKRARLDSCDDKIYDAYVRLIGYYKRTTALHESMSDVLVSPKLKNIIDGILSVVGSRLALAPPELTEQSAENPIFLEKKRIMNAGISEFGRAFAALSDGFTASELPECLAFARGLFVTLGGIDYDAAGLSLAREIGRRQDFALREEASAIYLDVVARCVAQLNDTGSRDEILRYNELLEKEREILSSIVDIKVFQSGKGACSPTEESVADDILAPLIEAYARLNKDLSEIHTSAGEQLIVEEDTVSALWVDESLKKVLSATNYTGFAGCIKAELTEVYNSLEYEMGLVTEREISNRLYARAMYDYRKAVTNNLLMADEMLAVFERLERATGSELPEGDEGAIINGITETVSIKIESLRENRNEFEETTSEKLKGLRRSRPRIELPADCALEPEITPEARAEFLESCRKERQRHISAYSDFYSKKCLAFKRECLLFEIITFDEIMHYSVTRIRGSDNESVRLFVMSVDEAWATLQNILGKNKITPIAPEAHEMFNGREHEVLTVEKNPEFKKGEIIKLMNSGYKQDDIVLVRANVVAAV